MDQMLTPKKFAELYGKTISMTEKTARGILRDPSSGGFKMGGRFYIFQSAAERWRASRGGNVMDKPKEIESIKVKGEGVKTDWTAFDAAMSDTWTNNACLGYAIKGMVDAELEPEQIRRVVREIKHRFDMWTVEEADKWYCNQEY